MHKMQRMAELLFEELDAELGAQSVGLGNLVLKRSNQTKVSG